ncbi:O-antigen ligase family protein [Cognataquiflexum rubidum]|uniref:O-antigen ligase family protein n=1 Tax=Cognataquiflexum rubidum TaxID=2922273 RepID=UPI001F141743|nr:O-antigen ligase family protein [Cognataquiflexum rubidum]MCH6234020.1 O-antigen ligase family protein [Cognataquiflexum rubidum]
MIEYFLFIFVILGFVPLLYYTLQAMVFRGKWEYIIYFILAYLPFHITVMSIVYQATHSPVAVLIFQSTKDILVLLGILLFFLYNRNIFNYPLRLNKVDWIFTGFIGLAFLYMILPLGETAFINKVFYFKNMLIPTLVYFLGRNSKFNAQEISKVFRIVFTIAIAAFLFNVLEKLIDTHIQSYTGYALFIQGINQIEPTGNFGLQWTFETQATTKRFASFFADPLELASSVLMGFAAGLIWFLTSKREYSIPYLVVMACSMGSLIFSSSRAAFAAFFIMIFFIAIVFKLYKLVLFGLSGALTFVVFILFFASEDFYYFVVDTLTFQNASSAGHVLEWLMALESMIENPLGIGLAMSGNSGSVTDEVRVGGENQFLIYGVQLGFIGMGMYILLLYYSITYSLKVFREEGNVMTARVAFTAASVKIGMLLPLFTANAEMYGYVSWVSWWMVGYAMNHLPKAKTTHGEA